MDLRDLNQLGQKTAEIATDAISSLRTGAVHAMVGLVSGACRTQHLKRIPSLFRGLAASFVATPVLFPALIRVPGPAVRLPLSPKFSGAAHAGSAHLRFGSVPRARLEGRTDV